MSDTSQDISVLICTKDRPDALRKCLKSIALSTLQPMEVVVVDQSANGATAKLVRHVSENSGLNIRHLKQDAVGHTKARNTGVQTCRGSVIAFTDDDCIVHPDWLAHISSEFGDSEVDCVCGATLPSVHDERPKATLLSTLHCRKRRVLPRFSNPVSTGRGNNMALRKTEIISLGGFNERIGVGTNIYAGDDIDLFYRLQSASRKIIQCPDAVVYHHQPDEWISVARKKRGYAISVAAILGCRARQGDIFAGVLLAGKIAYEFLYLFCGGILRLNRSIATIGWHSFMGSICGLKHVANKDLNEAITLLTFVAEKSDPERISVSPSDT